MMQERQENNEKWLSQLSEKLEGYQEQPSDSVWEGVSRKVLGTSLLRRWLIPGMTAAAALLLGTFLLTRPSSPSPDIITADAKVNADVTPRFFEDPVTSTANDWVPGDNLSEKKQTDDNGKIQGGNSNSKSQKNKNIDKTLSDKNIDRNPGETGIDQNRKAGAAESAEYSEETVSAEATPEPDDTNAAASKTSSEKEESIDNEVVRQKEEAKWAAIMAEEQAERKHSARRFSAGISVTGAGTASSSERQLTNAIMGANPLESNVNYADWVDGGFRNGESLVVYNQPEVETKYSHKLPVKFGVSFRYGFNEKLGIESGLTYTLLNSTFTTAAGTANGNTTGKQTLHYIGIPLNVTYNIIGSKLFNVYASAGGAMEKAVGGYFETTGHVDGKRSETNRNSLKPKELQWSLNASAGAQVNVLNQLGLYVEPGISYRIPSGSHVRSIYTDKKLDFSIGFGIRFNF
ncbi:MAG: porin family protein [Bacteroides sp.]|nr:porin family protein [Bacteroides sp.]